MNKINALLVISLACTIAPVSAMQRAVTSSRSVNHLAKRGFSQNSKNQNEDTFWKEVKTGFGQGMKDWRIITAGLATGVICSEYVFRQERQDAQVIRNIENLKSTKLKNEAASVAKGETSKPKQEVREKNQQAVAAENEYEVNSAILLRWELDLSPRETQEMVYNSAPNYYKVILKTPMGNLYPGKYHQYCWLLTEREMNMKQWRDRIVTVLGKANFKEFMDETDPKPHLDCCSKWCVDALKRLNKD